MIDKNKEFMVINENSFPVAVHTRFEEYILPAAEEGNGSRTPLTWEEILVINNNSKAFKHGFLMFEEGDKEELYKALRILDWEDIITNDEIKEIVLHPTADGIKKLIGVTDDAYFDRIRSVYTHLRNMGHDISNKIDAIINARYRELKNNKKTTAIVVTNPEPVNEKRDERIQELEDKIAKMEALISAYEKVVSTEAENKAEEKTAKRAAKPKEAKTSGKAEEKTSKKAETKIE